MAFGYDKLSGAQKDVLYEHIKQMPRDGVLVDLGCGPFPQDVKSLAQKMQLGFPVPTRHLVAADIIGPWLRDPRPWMGWPSDFTTHVSLLSMDARQIPLRGQSVDVVLALGLFGDLRVEGGRLATHPNQDGYTRAAREIFAEWLRILSPRGVALVSNSEVRQRRSAFLPLLDDSGFEVQVRGAERGTRQRSEGPADEDRYVVVLRVAARRYA